jgi:hypothetical protein
MKIRKWLMAISAFMALALLLCAGVPAMAQDQQPVTSITQLEKLYPMSPEKEAAIVHQVPPVDTIIIDGIKYESKDVALFNGRRLHFTSDKYGQMYAFTSAEELDLFIREQACQVEPSQTKGDLGILAYGSSLYHDVLFQGTSVDFNTNEPVWDFGTMNYQGSSLINQSGVATTLYDDTFFSGDSHTFNMPGASYYWEIWSIGWNDRACSGVCFYL